MSIPLTACLISKAAIGNEGAYQELLRRIRYNKKFGAFSVFPCECKPPCPVASNDQMEALDTRIRKENAS